MTDMFFIPEKGSPVDIARELTYSDAVQAAIEELIDVLRSEGERLGIPEAVITAAIAQDRCRDIPLDDLIAMKVEEGFTAALSNSIPGR